MDADANSTLWARLGRLFRRDHDESLEKAIIEARAEGEVAPEEESMLLSVLRFNEQRVQDVMTPRTDIDCVPVGSALLEVAKVIVESGHSRIPVFSDTRDNIVGIAHAKDLLRCLLEPTQQHTAVDMLMRAPFFVPETKFVRELLQEFRTRKLHIAIALDEYGGTSGLITIEDVLEEIVGDIEDEHDAPKEEDIRLLREGCYELTGRALLEDIAALGVVLESDEVDTVGGYLSLLAGHVPAAGECFTLGAWTLTVQEADMKLIRRVLLEKHPSPAPEHGR